MEIISLMFVLTRDYLRSKQNFVIYTVIGKLVTFPRFDRFEFRLNISLLVLGCFGLTED